MYVESMISLSIISLVAVFSLAWFVVGLVVGRQVSGSKKPLRQRHKKPQRPRKRSGKNIEIYVGNLSYDIREKELKNAFAEFGDVGSVRIIKNNFNGKSKGYGFVDMFNRREAEAAISDLNGADLKGRRVVVNEAKSQPRD